MTPSPSPRACGRIAIPPPADPHFLRNRSRWTALDLSGLPYDGGSALLHAAFLAFWGVMLVLHVLALRTGRGAYAAAIAALLALAAWNWSVHAVGLMGI
jgi:hypothetical protein